MDTHDKSHHRNMTAQAWREQIDDIAAAIHVKESRLAALAHEKALALTDTKRLHVLEAEETGLPAAIETLKRRLPLLNQEHEAALKGEAAERLGELAQRGAEAATEVSASRAAIRLAMQSVLDAITAAHADWDLHGVIAAEAAYLSVRFGLAPLQIPRGARLSPEETHRFKRQFDVLLRHSPNAQPWDRMRSDLQEAKRRAEQQRQALADKDRPNTPQFHHFAEGVRGQDSGPAALDMVTPQPGASHPLVGARDNTAAALRNAIGQE